MLFAFCVRTSRRDNQGAGASNDHGTSQHDKGHIQLVVHDKNHNQTRVSGEYKRGTSG